MKYNKSKIIIILLVYISLLLIFYLHMSFNMTYKQEKGYSQSYNQNQSIDNEKINNIGGKVNDYTINIKIEDTNLYNSIVDNISESILFEKQIENNTIIISNDELMKIKSLKLNNNEIKSIDGLDKFIYLEELNLRNNLITDASLLKNLTSLVKLDISHNLLKNINDLNKLNNLKELNIYDNLIYDFDGLDAMNNLETLIAGDNNEQGKCSENDMKISSIGTLSSLKTLDFSRNNIGRIFEEVVKLKHLENLNLSECKITDTNINNAESTIDNLITIKKLNLYGNEISSLDKLKNLANIEDLNVGNNKLTLINGLIDNGEFVFKNLKKINISNNKNLAKNNTNSEVISYLKDMDKSHTIEVNYEYLCDTSNLPHIDKNGIRYVTYEDFGARCDGEYDDFIAIRNAHNYANTNNVEVRATSEKTYHIFKYNSEKAILIESNVDWKNAQFVIHDELIEDNSGRYSYIFLVRNYSSDITRINNPNITLNKTSKKISGIDEVLNSLNQKNYNKYLCIAENSNKKQYIRYGSNANSGINQNDCFIIDNEGNIQNDIQWDFDSITQLTIYPFSDKQLSIKNGNFITKTFEDSHESMYDRNNGKNNYLYRGIYFYTSHNTIVENINHTMSDDVLSGVYHSFFRYQKCANITMKDCSIYSHKYKIGSTYDLIIEQCVNCNYINIVSNDILDTSRWGINGTNNCKDIVFDGCQLNRIDSHQGIYNLTIKNSQIGCYGISQIGQGNLNVIDSLIEAEHLIRLRWDYGSTWDGRIKIINCTHKYNGEGSFKLLNYSIAKDGNTVHDFGYDLHMPDIHIENLIIDCGKKEDIDKYLFIPNLNESDAEIMPLDYWPKEIYVNNYKFINSDNNPKIQILNKDINLQEGTNYVITNTRLYEVNGNDLTQKFNENEKVLSNKEIELEIKENNSSKNSIIIEKDNEKICEQEIKNSFKYSFSDKGKYRISIISTENVFNKQGTKIYEFEITSHIHKLKKISEKAPTCTEDGYREHYECSGCGEWFNDNLGNEKITNKLDIIIEKTGHDWGDWIVTKAATQMECGEEKRICKKNKNHVETREIPKLDSTPIDDSNEVEVKCRTHVQDDGWHDYVKMGEKAGSEGRSKRLEAFQLDLKKGNYQGEIKYSSHVQDIGWQGYVSNNQISGTVGRSLRVEAIKIELTGEIANYYDIYYRTHCENYGWLGWAKNGYAAGTAGQSLRLESIQIMIVKKGKELPKNLQSNEDVYKASKITYSTHVQDYGWLQNVNEGEISGTTGQSKRLEALKINLMNSEFSGSVEYEVHIQDIGWNQNFRKDGSIAGTTGQSKRTEAIKIKLTGEMANRYDIYYRTHCENYGWLGWAKNGECAGTVGQSLRMEALEIILIKKGEKIPTYMQSNNKTYIEK